MEDCDCGENSGFDYAWSHRDDDDGDVDFGGDGDDGDDVFCGAIHFPLLCFEQEDLEALPTHDAEVFYSEEEIDFLTFPSLLNSCHSHFHNDGDCVDEVTSSQAGMVLHPLDSFQVFFQTNPLI